MYASMHDYSRDIMLANAQQDMEENLKKMQLNKKIALTKTNVEKAASLKKQNDELGYMFLPTQVSVDILQGKDPREMTQKIDRAALLMVEIFGVGDFCAKAKPVDVVNFYNNMESVWDHIVKINKCFKLDRKTEYFVTAGSADKIDNPLEAIANCALDMMDVTKRALMNPATGKPITVSVSFIDHKTVSDFSSLACHWLWSDHHCSVDRISAKVWYLWYSGHTCWSHDCPGSRECDPPGTHQQESPARHVQGEGFQGGGRSGPGSPAAGQGGEEASG